MNNFDFSFQATSGGPGALKLNVNVDGQDYEVPRPAGAPKIPAVQGKPYVFKMTSTVPNNSYIINLTLP